MATVLPSSRAQMIQWFRQRIVGWVADPTGIGLSVPIVTDLALKLDAAENDQETALEARMVSKSATLNYYTTSDDLRSFGSDVVQTIKLFAETTSDPSVYAAANVPPPSPPTPLGPPATPQNLSATLNTAGEIKLEWDSSRAGGTSFTVQRSTTGPTGQWTIVGTSEEVSFTDTAVPRGFDAVSYRVIASRSGGSSNPTAAVSVLFGNTDTASGSGEGLSLAA